MVHDFAPRDGAVRPRYSAYAVRNRVIVGGMTHAAWTRDKHGAAPMHRDLEANVLVSARTTASGHDSALDSLIAAEVPG